MKIAIKAAMAVALSFGLALPLTANANDCGRIRVQIPESYEIFDISCSQGKIDYASYRTIDFRQDFFKGPTCTITIKIGQNTNISAFVVHQDYCAYKAGDITVTHTGGPRRPIYTATKGSYKDNHPGRVYVTNFE